MMAVLMAALIMVGLCGCDIIEKLAPTPGGRIAFGREGTAEEISEKVMTSEEIASFQYSFRRYRSDFHYSLLNENQRKVYEAYEYALENNYRYIYVDRSICGSEEELIQTLDYFSLDTPLLEQNLDYGTGTFTGHYLNGIIPSLIEGNYILIENFNELSLGLKKDSLKKAEEVVSSMPKDLSEIEKARYLHRYTFNNVVYYDYEGNYDVKKNFCLYDGLVNGKTHCDGSSNMLSLLFEMAGIEAFEKRYDGDTEDGHTWNMFKIEDRWYNADATALGEKESVSSDYETERYFGFEDRMQRYVPEYEEVYPKCEKSVKLNINAEIEKIEKNGFTDIVKKAFKENGEKYAVLLLKQYDGDAYSAAVQRLANNLQTTVTYNSFEVRDGKTLLIITA